MKRLNERKMYQYRYLLIFFSLLFLLSSCKCDDKWVNLLNDNNHCGACDVKCSEWSTCELGKCKMTFTFLTDEPYDLAVTNNVGAYTEIPFGIIPGGARQLNLSSLFTYSCYTFDNPLTDVIHLTQNECTRTLWTDRVDYSPENMPSGKHWRRNYNGIFTQHVISTISQDRVIAFNHGENKNEIVGNDKYQNTVNTDVSVNDCASGNVDGQYYDCWEAYNGFINMSWQISDAAHDWGMQPHNDEGPIVWPSNGYTYNGEKSSHGVRHPHGIIVDDYIYLFYIEENAGGDVKVARAPMDSGGLPGSFKTYCDGTWNDSLPTGFTKENMEAFFSQRGGCASSVIPSLKGIGSTISFAVAKMTIGDYISVEEALVGNKWQIRIRVSSDLVNWSTQRIIRSIDGDWRDADLAYPIFLSSNGWDNYLIDPANFYIIGTKDGQVRAMHVGIKD